MREDETLQSQIDHRFINPERIVDGEINARQNQLIVTGSNIDGIFRKVVDNAVMTVKNRMHDAILTEMDTLVLPRVEMAVRSITGSSGHGPTSIVQNPGRRDFIGNTENTLLRSVSGRLDLNFDQDKIDDTRDIENFENGDFPALRPKYDPQAHAHHTWVFP